MSTENPNPPSATGDNGRDPVNGRFAAGNKHALGRAPAFDLRRISEEKAAAEDISLEDAVWEVMKALIEKAKAGDSNAAKIVLDRLCGPIRQELDVELAGTAMSENCPKIPTGKEADEWIEQWAEMRREEKAHEAREAERG